MAGGIYADPIAGPAPSIIPDEDLAEKSLLFDDLFDGGPCQITLDALRDVSFVVDSTSIAVQEETGKIGN